MESLYKEEEDGFKSNAKGINDQLLNLELRKSASKEVLTRFIIPLYIP